MISEKDKYFLKLAIKQALKGKFYTHPNPRVGCVIVKGEKIISKGYHAVFGGPHAEVNAIKNALDKVKNSTVYVTLEPCSTYGKTPPCTDLIIKSGIKRVVIGSIDPNPLHRGKAVDILKRNGIEVDVADGEISQQCKDINEVFFKNMLYNMPYITIKLAVSVDGRIADINNRSKWISCEESRKYLHELRAYSDCIVVGKKTVIYDNPNLNVRGIKVLRQPDVCVIDRRLEIPYNSNIFKHKRRVFIVCEKKDRSLKGVFFIKPTIKNGRIILRDVVKKLYFCGVRHILVEGGGYTVSEFINQKLYDRIILFISPVIIGKGIEWFPQFVSNKNDKLGLRLKFSDFRKISDDIFVELKNV